MRYFWNLFVRSLGETWDFVVDQKIAAIFISILVFAVGLWLKHRKADELKAELADAWIGFLAIAVVFAAVWTFHFFYQTPKNMLNEKNAALEQSGEDKKALQKQLDDLTRPVLIGRIEMIAVGLAGGPMTNISSVLVIATIKNLGAPSIAENFKITIITTKGENWMPSIAFIHKDGIIFDGVRRYVPEDALYTKGSKEPIVKGFQITGVIQGLMQGKTREEIFTAGNIVRLSFQDILGANYHCDYVITEHMIGDRYIPGTTPVFEKMP